MNSIVSDKFTLEVGGRAFECERVVFGKRVLRQEIRVFGIGSKEDPASYGRKYHPVSSMASVARVIARELIEKERI
jgi:hypothetical protein